MGTKKINLVVVTGMSGAGKTVAIQSFEDIGYFTIDNMPPSLVPKVIELVKHSEETDKIALVIDMRSRLFFDEINDILDKLESNEELNFKILFLDATDGELVSRYKETRRSHPLDCHWMQIWFLMFVSCQILIMILHFVTSQVWIKRFLIMS